MCKLAAAALEHMIHPKRSMIFIKEQCTAAHVRIHREDSLAGKGTQTSLIKSAFFPTVFVRQSQNGSPVLTVKQDVDVSLEKSTVSRRAAQTLLIVSYVSCRDR